MSNTLLICDKCGEEAGSKIVGSNVYDWCEDCGCVEGATHEEPYDET